MSRTLLVIFSILMPKQCLYGNSKLDCLCSIARLAHHGFREPFSQDVKGLVLKINKPFQNLSTVAKNAFCSAKSTRLGPFLHQGLRKQTQKQKHSIESHS